MAEQKKDSFWQRIRHPYRLSLVDASSLKSLWHIPLTGLGAFSLLTLLFVLTIVLLSLLIIYTPVRNMLPGYSEDMRQDLVDASARVDSLDTELEMHHTYLEMVRQIVAGEVKVDSVNDLDSLALATHEQLMTAKNEATEEFMAQYETKKDNFQLFDIQENTPVYTMFCPVHGVVMTHFSEQSQQYGIFIRTADKENISAVLTGAVVYVHYEIDNTYTMMLQHNMFLTIYRHVGQPIKKVGDAVQPGESIALASGEHDLAFEIWQQGKPVNPEEVIVF